MRRPTQEQVLSWLKRVGRATRAVLVRWIPLIMLAAGIFNLVFYMHREVSDYESVSWHIIMLNYVMMFFDTFAVTLLFVLLPVRSTRWVALPLLLGAFFTVGNALYARNIGSYMPINAWFEFQNLQGLGSSIFGNLLVQDYIIMGTTLVLVVMALCCRRPLPRWRERVPVLLALVVIFGGIHMWQTRADAQSDDEWNETEFSTELYIGGRPSYIFTHGMFWSLALEISSTGYTIELTEEQRQEVAAYLDRPAFKHEMERPRHVLFVIVESLITDPIGKVIDGVEVTPTLNRLRSRGFFCGQVASEVRYGESSDGQFIYMTGLLPKISGITIFDNMQNEYHGLGEVAHEAGYTTVLINPTGRNFWRQEQVCAKYGIDHHYSADEHHQTMGETPASGSWLNDEQVFNYAYHQIRQHEQDSIFMSILTISTHTPYGTSFDERRATFPSVDDDHYANFLEKANYMDYHFGRFLDRLEADSLLQDAVIVVVADHAAPDKFGMEEVQPTPLIICGRGIEPSECRSPMRQIDLYPTLLNLMGFAQRPYMGLGHSVFDMDSTYIPATLAGDEAQRISNLIIYGDYWGKANEKK